MGRLAIRLIALGWSVSFALHALPTYGDTSQSFGDFSGEGLQSLGGLAQSPEADLFTGSLTLSVPIVISPGRKNTTPELKLVYSSTAGDGPFGHGWSLPLGSIERSTKHGVPRCNAPDPDSRTDHTNDFILNLNGAVQELVPVSGSTTTYRVKTDEGFIEATVDSANNRWEVRDRAGMKYTFGLDAESRLHKGNDVFFDAGSCSFTSVWYLARVEDPNGNLIEIDYQEPSGTHYPQTIYYGGTASGASHVFRVDFTTETRSTQDAPASLSYRRGVKEKWDHVVTRIEVEADGDTVRTYELDYSACSDTSRALLCSVADGNPGGDPDQEIPTQSFEYSTDEFGHYPCAALQSRGYEIAAGTCDHAYIGGQLRVADGDGQLSRTFMDLNGDGFVDRLQPNTSPGTAWDLYQGSSGGVLDVGPLPWLLRSAAVTQGRIQDREPDGAKAYVRRDTLDLTGDGIADFVDGQVLGTWTVYPGGYCDSNGCGFSPSAASISFEDVPSFAGPEKPNGDAKIRFEHRVGTPNQNGTTYYTRRRLVDFNGDGLFDLLDFDSSADRRDVFLNTGVVGGEGHFEEAPDLQHGSYNRAIHQEEIVLGFRSTITDLFDFNGDGLADILIREPTTATTEFKLNQGGGEFTEIWELPIEIRSINKTTQDTVKDFVDVNGDGLADYVDALAGTWSVRLNTGTTLADSQPWLGDEGLPIPGPIRNDTKSGNAKKDILDWNGDGLMDIVNAQTNPWQVLLGAPRDATAPWVRPGLLLRAHNGIGGVTEVDYTPSAAFDNDGGDARQDLSLVTWVVTGVRRTDGLCPVPPGVDPFDRAQNPCIDAGHEIVKTIAYEGGRFDPAAREFRGFRTVTETDMDGSTRVVTFSQDEHTRGKIETDERFAGGSQLVRRERFVWNTRASLSRTQVYLAEHRVADYDPDSGGSGTDPNQHCVMNGNDVPDDFGRVHKTCTRRCDTTDPTSIPAPDDVCEVGLELGQVNTITSWANPIGGSSVRERPDWVQTESYTDTGFTTLTAKYFLYDNLGQSAQVTRGNVTKVTTRLGPTLGDGDDPEVNMEYDVGGSPSYGNLLRTTDPRGNVSKSEFDAAHLFGLYPDAEEALEDTVHRVTKDWSIAHGKPTEITDPNGQTTFYEYDPQGRPTCEAKPDDDCETQPTAKYVYHWGVPGSGST